VMPAMSAHRVPDEMTRADDLQAHRNPFCAAPTTTSTTSSAGG
jgi:hypothetical protein